MSKPGQRWQTFWMLAIMTTAVIASRNPQQWWWWMIFGAVTYEAMFPHDWSNLTTWIRYYNNGKEE